LPAHFCAPALLRNALLGAQKRRKAGTLGEIKPLEYSEERAASMPRLRKD
jgi:hypothetical protein